MKKPSIPYGEFIVESLKGQPKAQAEYIRAIVEENPEHPRVILIGLRHVAEARGFKRFAQECGLNRETLYKTLSENGNPTLESLVKMLGVLGLGLSVKPRKRKAG